MSIQTQELDAVDPAPIQGGVLPALDQVFAETVALFHRLRAVAPLMHSHAELEQEQCTILQGLDREGSRTVTDIGNDCGIARNQAQKLVKALDKAGFVAMVDNPENKRAKLVELTDEGRRLCRELDQREIELLTSLPLASTAGELAAAAQVLADVRRALNDPAWRKGLGD